MVTVVTVRQDGLGKGATSTLMTVLVIPAKMEEPAM